MPKKETVCAIVVTYNRKQLLIECLDSLLGQTHPLDAIYLIDNASTDGTPELLKEKGYIGEILNPKDSPAEKNFIVKMTSEGNTDKEVKMHYVRMHENTGGAGGFYEGAKRGYEKGYDWLWLMDDDAEPTKDCLSELFLGLEKSGTQTKAITSLRINRNGRIQTYHVGWQDEATFNYKHLTDELYNNSDILIKINYSSFVGLLVSSDVIKKVGFPDKEFFIWVDDREYSYRITKVGDMYLYKASIIVHKDDYGEDNARLLCMTSKTPRIKIIDFWKVYYGFRNSIYIAKKHKANMLKFVPRFLIFFLKTIGGVFLYDNYKFQRAKILFNACIDGYKGKMGKTLIPKEWNQWFR